MDWLQVGAFFVAVLGLGLAGLVYVTRQFNRMADRMDARFERLEGRIDARFERMDARFERVDARFERIDDRITRLEERIGSLEQGQARIKERLDRIEERLDQMQGEMKSLGEGLQNVEKEQARMLGFLEGRGVMGKAPANVETVS